MRVCLGEVPGTRGCEADAGSHLLERVQVRGGKTERRHRVVHRLRAAELQQKQRGRDIVGDDHHQPGEVFEREPDARPEVPEDAGSGQLEVVRHHHRRGRIAGAVRYKLAVRDEQERLRRTFGRHHAISSNIDHCASGEIAGIDGDLSRFRRDQLTNVVRQLHRTSFATDARCGNAATAVTGASGRSQRARVRLRRRTWRRSRSLMPPQTPQR